MHRMLSLRHRTLENDFQGCPGCCCVIGWHFDIDNDKCVVIKFRFGFALQQGNRNAHHADIFNNVYICYAWMFVTVNGICCTDLLIDTRTKERRAHTKIHKCEYVSMLLAVKCLRASSLQFICGNSHCCSLLLQCMLQHQHTHTYKHTQSQTCV